MAGVWDTRRTSVQCNANGYLGRFAIDDDLFRRISLPIPGLQVDQLENVARFWQYHPCSVINPMLLSSRYDRSHNDHYVHEYPNANPTGSAARDFTGFWLVGSDFLYDKRLSCSEIVLGYDEQCHQNRCYGQSSNNSDQSTSGHVGIHDEDEGRDEEERFNDDQYPLGCPDGQEDDVGEAYDEFLSQPDMSSGWIQWEDESGDTTRDDHGDDESLTSPDHPGSDWIEEEDEGLMPYLADWEDLSDLILLEEDEGLAWYANDREGSWEEVSSSYRYLSEEMIDKNLKTRAPEADSADEHEICAVCQDCLFEEDDRIALLDCGHEYHIKCIKNWLIKKNCCPLCKAKGISVN